MRTLSVVESDAVSGGDVVISARRYDSDYYYGIVTFVDETGDGGGGSSREDAMGLIDITQEAWKWINAAGKLMDYREGRMSGIDMSKLEKKVVDGFTQWNDKEKGWFYLDIDKDGMIDTRFKEVNGQRYIDWNGAENWLLSPDRADWRAGFWLDANGNYGDPYKFNPNNN